MTFLWYISLQHQQKVAVLGAAGGIGQPMSLLMKESPAISHLALYDIVNTPGRQFKPSFAEISSLLHWNNEEYRDRTVWKLNWDLGKKYYFFPKGSVWSWEKGSVLQAEPKSPLQKRSQANYEVTVQSQWGMWFSGALSLNQSNRFAAADKSCEYSYLSAALFVGSPCNSAPKIPYWWHRFVRNLVIKNWLVNIVIFIF